MAIYVKNPTLKTKVFKQITKYNNLALKAYSKGKIKVGNKYEKKTDKLYSKNYNKIFARR